MMDKPTTTNWLAAWTALAELDGDAWGAESERLDALWETQYKLAFVKHALSRPGWDAEDAELWAADIVGEALLWCRCRDCAPETAAAQDVIECERESA
jgi:hypothetical protein